MVPTLSQQLSAIRHTIEKTIMPALDPTDSFAQEQAGLVLASLDWSMDVATSEHRYEQVEQGEYRSALQALLALEDDGEAQDALDASATPAADLPGLRAANLDLKRQVERRFQALTASPDDPHVADARRIVTKLALSQNKRESAWARMTGFPTNVDGSIEEVLAAQAAG